MPKETYLQARERLFRELPAKGYRIVTYNMARMLKTPYAIDPDGQRFDFHPQAVYDHDASLSLWMDIRGMSADAFHDNIVRHKNPHHRSTR
jgi:hypothetical protein